MQLRIGVIGHVEHITLGRVTALPGPGDIAHLESPRCLPGGGGGIAFFQLIKGPAQVHLFTAFGDDDAAAFVEAAVAGSGAVIHATKRPVAHTRDVVMIDPLGERTIVVVGEPLHPRASDSLPWDLLAELDAVYFTAQDPALLVRAREARLLIATARRQPSIAASGVRLDAVIGSRSDPRESSERADYAVPPDAVVMTEGAQGGGVETEAGTTGFSSPQSEVIGGAYGAGDSFAGAFVYYLASGCDAATAASRAAPHGAAVVAGLDPITSQTRLT